MALIAGAEIVAAISRRARLGLSLDNSLHFHQLPELADFARAVPDLTIIVDHIGGLLRSGPYANRDDEVLPLWREGVATVAQCPNIVMKLGWVGQTRYGFDWPERGQPIGSEELAVDIFLANPSLIDFLI